ncbi:hypothetical protein [Bosea sp. BK604]|nr:hypothetical protein [Bosea sp. BK604]TCR60677.1 hypothetical protein EV560_116164 [Bosea sp. BK604]
MPPPGDWGFLAWIFAVSVPLGLAAATFWARGLRNRRPKVPPGDPGNPV